MTDSSLIVREFLLTEWSLYRDLRLRALQDSPDAFGSTYAAECGRTDSEWAERLARGVISPDELPLVAEWKGAPSGLAWVRVHESASGVAHLYQMWVAPERRRHRIARALLVAATKWARSRGAEQIELDVALNNEAAVRLYQDAGFLAYGEPRPIRDGATLRSQSMQRPLDDDNSSEP